MTDPNGSPLLNTLEGVAALELAARNGAIVTLAEKSPTGETVVLAPNNFNLHKLAPLEPVLPKRVRAIETLVEPESFAAYINRFKTATSVAFASLSLRAINAVLDYHGASPATGLDEAAPAPQPAGHKVSLKTEYDPDWLAWCAAFDGDAMDQEKFARFLDDMAHTIGTPTLAELLDMVRTIDIERSVKLKSRKIDQSGAVQLTYEELDSSGGLAGTGQVTIPSQIGLTLPVFQGTSPVSFFIKLRYSLGRGHIAFSVDLPGRDKLVRDEFRKIGDAIVLETSIPLFYAA